MVIYVNITYSSRKLQTSIALKTKNFSASSASPTMIFPDISWVSGGLIPGWVKHSKSLMASLSSSISRISTGAPAWLVVRKMSGEGKPPENWDRYSMWAPKETVSVLAKRLSWCFGARRITSMGIVHPKWATSANMLDSPNSQAGMRFSHLGKMEIPSREIVYMSWVRFMSLTMTVVVTVGVMFQTRPCQTSVKNYRQSAPQARHHSCALCCFLHSCFWEAFSFSHHHCQFVICLLKDTICLYFLVFWQFVVSRPSSIIPVGKQKLWH